MIYFYYIQLYTARRISVNLFCEPNAIDLFIELNYLTSKIKMIRGDNDERTYHGLIQRADCHSEEDERKSGINVEGINYMLSGMEKNFNCEK